MYDYYRNKFSSRCGFGGIGHLPAMNCGHFCTLFTAQLNVFYNMFFL